MQSSGYTPLGIGAGTLIDGRYELVRRLGAGGLSVVYQAVDRKLNNNVVALKLFSPGASSDERAIKRLENEILITRELTHPNIVRTFEFGDADSKHCYLAMEYIDGFPLDQFIAQDRHAVMSYGEIARLLHDIAQAVSFAHHRGVVHRDLKPGNILITQEGQIKIVDFGLALRMETDNRLTQDHECVGTPLYMAPEQVRGEDPDVRTDIYAIGVMAYQLAVGEVPFYHENWFELANQILNTPLPEFKKNSGIPEWFQAFILKAAAKNPDDRFQDLDELIEALSAHYEVGDGKTQSIDLRPRVEMLSSKNNHGNSINFSRHAPLMLLTAVLVLFLVASIGVSRNVTAKATEDLSKSRDVINEFSDTLNKLHQVVMQVHQDKDKIDAYLQHDQPQ